MDKSMMSLWVEKCHFWWIDALPPNTIPLLVVDSFFAQILGSIVENFNRVKFKFITSPVDVHTCANPSKLVLDPSKGHVGSVGGLVGC